MTPVLYIAHGGGPLPLLGDPAHAQLVQFLRDSHQWLPRPAAILVVSAHWEAPVATLTTNPAPDLYYDYYGFPPESYEIRYPAPGAPELAATVLAELRAAGIAAAGDDQRGFDHGLFVPLKLMFPQADIPCLQLSLLQSLDPAAHIALGRAIAALRERGVLILGSGSSFHNMQGFRDPDRARSQQKCRDFDQWLERTCCELPPQAAAAQLVRWQDAPQARYAHPREEHLLPLHVCCGAAGTGRVPARRVFNGDMMGYRMAAFVWD